MTRLKQKARRRAVAEELGISARGAANVIRKRAHCEHTFITRGIDGPVDRLCTTCGLVAQVQSADGRITNANEKEAQNYGLVKLKSPDPIEKKRRWAVPSADCPDCVSPDEQCVTHTRFG